MRAHVAIPLLVAVLAATLAVALAAGPTGWKAPWRLDEVMLELRAPRVLLAALIGASLALAGVAMQTLLQNDLAEPYVLGLSGGASAGAVASLALVPAVSPSFAAAAGAAGAVAIVRVMSRGAFDPARMILAGVAVGSLLAGVTGLVLALAPGDRVLRSATFWLFGGIGTPRWSMLVVPALMLVASMAWLLARARRLDRLTLGQDIATALGVDVLRVRRGALCVAIALTAVAVAAAGIVGFVGLVAPHVARRWVGAPHRQLLPVAALGGAILVTTADVAARTLFAPREVPVGLLTAAVGGPFFLWQLQRGAA